MFQGMEYVYEIYKQGSFSKAAKKLYVSQPSLSATVKRVETKIGYPIFDRSKKPLVLTECGEHYIKTVEQILSAKNEFTNFLNDWGDLKLGKLSIGGGSLFLAFALPPLICEFTSKFPGVHVELLEDSTGRLLEYMQNGLLDVVLDNNVLDEELYDSVALKEEHLMLAVPRSFEENERLKEYQISVDAIRDGSYLNDEVKPIDLKEFAEDPFILLKQENDTRERAMHICKENKFEPNIIFELDQQMTSYNITSSGMGISFLSDTLIAKMPQNPNLVYYKLKGEHTKRQIYFYWKKGRYVSRPMEEFLRMVVKKYA